MSLTDRALAILRYLTVCLIHFELRSKNMELCRKQFASALEKAMGVVAMRLLGIPRNQSKQTFDGVIRMVMLNITSELAR